VEKFISTLDQDTMNGIILQLLRLMGKPEIGFRLEDPLVVVAMVTLLFWLCSEGLLQLLGFRQPNAERRDSLWWYCLHLPAFYGALVFSLLDATVLHWTIVGPAFDSVRWDGVPLVAVGLVLRLVSRLALGKQFSVHVQTTPGHRLITTGIYRFIRHPLYLGLICLLLGIPLCFGSVAGFACGLAVAATVLHRIHTEEAALAGWFPGEYRQYQARTHKFIPAWTKAQTAMVIGVVLLLAAGTATIAVKENAAHRHEAWREKFDLSVLDTAPPQVSILPSIHSMVHWVGSCNGKARGFGQSVPDLLMFAYGVRPAQLIPTVPVPFGKYDFIANLTTGIEANQEGLQQETKTKFGLIVRRETIETNVLVLTVQSRNAAGLKPTAGQLSGSWWHFWYHFYSVHDQSISTLVDYLEDSLGTVVIDQTGLTDNFDIDFEWDSTPESLKPVLLDQLGLKLTPARKNVTFAIVDKADGQKQAGVNRAELNAYRTEPL
jgi:uncharacterized protein (TIGR03435 family)